MARLVPNRRVADPPLETARHLPKENPSKKVRRQAGQALGRSPTARRNRHHVVLPVTISANGNLIAQSQLTTIPLSAFPIARANQKTDLIKIPESQKADSTKTRADQKPALKKIRMKVRLLQNVAEKF
jgi:hypothetical protein